jgi:hypothetical protein
LNQHAPDHHSTFLNNLTTLDVNRSQADDLVNFGDAKCCPYDESNLQQLLKRQPSRARKLVGDRKKVKSNLFSPARISNAAAATEVAAARRSVARVEKSPKAEEGGAVEVERLRRSLEQLEREN